MDVLFLGYAGHRKATKAAPIVSALGPQVKAISPRGQRPASAASSKASGERTRVHGLAGQRVSRKLRHDLRRDSVMGILASYVHFM